MATRCGGSPTARYQDAAPSASAAVPMLAAGVVFGGILGGALLVGLIRSGWAGWIVAMAAVSLLAVLAAVPLGVVALVVALVHPGGRGWLAGQVAQAQERRHAVRLAAARRVEQQHVHLASREEMPQLEVLPSYLAELPEGRRR
ncbi:MAG TPA: hypothetical protein VMU20_17580 [Candidatus Dormibacteraeota bacterium]|nr:hypothetical protein [Candidatus Dormibacteraeota bacterium]